MNLQVFRDEVSIRSGGIPMHIRCQPTANGKGKPRFSAQVIIDWEAFTVIVYQQANEIWKAVLQSQVSETYAFHPYGTGALEKVFENLRSGKDVETRKRPAREVDRSRW